MWKHSLAAWTCPIAARTQPPAAQTGSPSSIPGPMRWTQQALARAGPLDVSLHQLHCLFEFIILFGEGLHPLDQLVPLLGSPSYPLQTHNDNDKLRSPTSKTSIIDAVLTLIYFITPARADSSLLSSLVVSSSTTTTSSPCLWRIRTAWGQGSLRSISSTSSSSVVAGGTT